MRQRRAAARSRAWAIARARTVTPGSKTLRSTSQAVARSNSRLGRSARVGLPGQVGIALRERL